MIIKINQFLTINRINHENRARREYHNTVNCNNKFKMSEIFFTRLKSQSQGPKRKESR